MANRYSGVAELTGSDGQTYSLKFGTNAICKIEEQYDKSFNDIAESLRDEKTLRVGVIRTMLQVSMKGNPSAEQVGDLIDDVGMEQIGRVLAEMFGVQKPADEAASNVPQSAGELTGASVS